VSRLVSESQENREYAVQSNHLQSLGASANGASLSFDSTYIYCNFVPGPGTTHPDTFSYTIADDHGNTATALIPVTFVPMYGIPNYTYVVETTTNSLPTSNWWPVSTNVAGTNGLWIFTDPNATNTMQFYRSVVQ
jgi:hypothetical protein